MCGLALAFSKRGKNTGEYVYSLFTKQRHRGQQGFGYLAINEGKLTKIYRSKFSMDIQKEMAKDKSDIILFHHRQPTSTKNTVGTTHPIFVSNPELKFDYYFAHNGVITNDDLLKTKHNKLGYVYTTEFLEKTTAKYLDGREEELTSTTTVFNDSEALAIELARWIEDLDVKINTNGGAAFWGIQLEKGTDIVTQVFFGKNKGRELKIFDNKNWMAISSESGTNIKDMKFFAIDINDWGMTETDLPIDIAEPVDRTVTRHVSNAYTTAAERASHERGSDDERTMGFTFPKGVGRTPVGELPFPQNLLPSSHNIVTREKDGSSLSPFSLPNAWYTYDEAIETGFTFADTFMRTVGPGGSMCYVPTIYVGNPEGRIPFALTQGKTPIISGKAIAILDDCIEKILLNEALIAELEEVYSGKHMSTESYTEQVTKAEIENEELEQKISTLGFSENYCQERLDEARDVWDYQQSSGNTVLTDKDFEDINLNTIII